METQYTMCFPRVPYWVTVYPSKVASGILVVSRLLGNMTVKMTFTPGYQILSSECYAANNLTGAHATCKLGSLILQGLKLREVAFSCPLGVRKDSLCACIEPATTCADPGGARAGPSTIAADQVGLQH